MLMGVNGEQALERTRGKNLQPFDRLHQHFQVFVGRAKRHAEEGESMVAFRAAVARVQRNPGKLIPRSGTTTTRAGRNREFAKQVLPHDFRLHNDANVSGKVAEMLPAVSWISFSRNVSPRHAACPDKRSAHSEDE